MQVLGEGGREVCVEKEKMQRTNAERFRWGGPMGRSGVWKPTWSLFSLQPSTAVLGLSSRSARTWLY